MTELRLAVSTKTPRPHTRWFWTLGGKAGQAFQLGLVGTGRAAAVEEAVAAFKMAYEQWLARRDSDSASA
jgi:hypothetical protein